MRLQAGARAAVLTPRGQNPTGAAVDASRGRELCAVLRHPEAVVIEDDYAAAVGGAVRLAARQEPALGRDPVALEGARPGPADRAPGGDPLTVSRVEGRQLLGPGWVEPPPAAGDGRPVGRPGDGDAPGSRRADLRRAPDRPRRAAASRGIAAQGSSGLGVWIPLAEEAATVQALLARGFAVSPGERYRFRTPPGIRITTTELRPPDAERLAAALDEILRERRGDLPRLDLDLRAEPMTWSSGRPKYSAGLDALRASAANSRLRQRQQHPPARPTGGS